MDVGESEDRFVRVILYWHLFRNRTRPASIFAAKAFPFLTGGWELRAESGSRMPVTRQEEENACHQVKPSSPLSITWHSSQSGNLGGAGWGGGLENLDLFKCAAHCDKQRGRSACLASSC